MNWAAYLAVPAVGWAERSERKRGREKGDRSIFLYGSLKIAPRDKKNRSVPFFVLENLLQRMPAILCVRPDLGGPTAVIDGLRPGFADQYLGTFDFVYCAETRLASGLHAEAFSGHYHGQRCALQAGYGNNAGDLGEQGDVLLVVHFVEDRLLFGVDVHTGDKKVAGLHGHGFTPWDSRIHQAPRFGASVPKTAAAHEEARPGRQ